MRWSGIIHAETWTLSFCLSLLWASSASAYMVSGAIDLTKLSDEADVIFKGTAVETLPLEDIWFQPCNAYLPRQTTFKILSVFKGDVSQSTVAFRHYDNDPAATFVTYMPQHYAFEPGRSYIVFADKVEDTRDLRQIWLHHKSKSDQGALLCADEAPISAASTADLYWQELTTLLRSKEPGDVKYAIGQLDSMSGGMGYFGATRDFDRERVVDAIHVFLQSQNEDIARVAIPVIGSHTPYLYDERTVHWLATVGSAEFPGLGKMDPDMKNIGAERYWNELVAVADGSGSIETRALAIRALGLLRDEALRSEIDRWLEDEAAEIRAAGTILLADFPDTAGVGSLRRLSEDSAPAVRVSVARAIGFSQQHELVDVLGTLMTDEADEVRREAAQSLLSISVEDDGVANTLKAHLEQEEFSPLFLNALARNNSEPYLDALAVAVETEADPVQWSGEMPFHVSRKLILAYLRSQDIERLDEGRLKRYFDAIEKVNNCGSDSVRSVYAFYMARGMKPRAAAFRAWAVDNIPYDVINYFRQVDDNPAYYDM